MSTPVATVADALISFILSLLRDPAAVEEFDAAPKAMLASKGLQDACAADVQAVKPIIVDNPHVIIKPVGPPPPPDPPDEVVKEIKHIINQFATIDNRTTIVDQSTNQNIWTEGGDVTQIFDQEAVVASGDEAVAAGDDATVVDSDVDVTIGDVAIGNTTNDGSFNTTGGDGEAAAPDVAADPAAADVDPADAAVVAGAAVEAAVDASLDASTTAVDTVTEAVTEQPAVVEAPAEDPLAADLTSTESYEAEDASTAVVDDAFVEEPIEEQ
ncbi:hypothetical protein SAMN04487846_1017 [Microbacterium sp. cf046]|uniref:IniB N-terminal domain-containing protein n=1 Tax=Microbacterium sp. cf046 TaxID=1761803 RepID=UPI0008E1BEE0|nr:IniB N-terminal domain-containing protein [Microbacterium sp. cf046]SFR94753.1 hypothetical protein SAMN04487846_1017 [Microbacterium sp. cf046]